MDRWILLLLLAALAPAHGAGAAGADLGVVAVLAEPSPEPGCTVPVDDLCAVTWDRAGTLAPGDDTLRTYVGLDTVAVVVRPPGGGDAVPPQSVSPSTLRVEHPVARTINATWRDLDAAEPEPLRGMVVFEVRPARSDPSRWGAFLGFPGIPGSQPVLDEPFLTLEPGVCWRPCLASYGGWFVVEDDAAHLFAEGVAGYDDTDDYLRWQLGELAGCQDVAEVPGACLALHATGPLALRALEAALEATPRFVGGWSFNRTIVGTVDDARATLTAVRARAGQDQGPSAAGPRGGLDARAEHGTHLPSLGVPLSDSPWPRGAGPSPAVLLAGTQRLDLRGAGIAGLALAATAATLGVALAAALYSRIARHRALDQATRRRIHDAIAAHPGIRVGTLQSRLGLNYNTVLRHVRVLVRCGLVEASGAGQRRYFVRGSTSGVAARRAAVAADAPAAQDVLRYLGQHGAVEVPVLRAALALPRSTASVALARLAAAGLVEKRASGRRLVVALAAQPQEGTASGLAAAPVQSTA